MRWATVYTPMPPTKEVRLSDLFCVREKVIWITGASSGMGLHLSSLMLEQGASVIASSRTGSRSGVLAELVTKHAGRLEIIDMDLESRASIHEATERVQGLFGHVDVLINNAGVALESLVAETTDDDWDRVIAINLGGPFQVMRAISGLIRDGGSIINISSTAAHRSIRGLAAYGASKAALEQFGNVLALELAPRGIRVNTVAPGSIRTPMNSDYLDSDESNKLRKRIPLRRFGSPDDLDGAILLLASEQSSFITGACIRIDGGFCL